MPLRRFHRIFSAIVVASLVIAGSDGLLCLIPCAASTAAAASRSVGQMAQVGHCATDGILPTEAEASAQPLSACARDYAIGEWIGERAVWRAFIEREPADAVDTLFHGGVNTPTRVTVLHPTTSASPPGALVRLRI